MNKYFILLLLLLPAILFAQIAGDYSNVFLYPHILSPQDILTDGPRGEPIKITEPTIFIWVDYYPLADFAHPTGYVLVSHKGVRLIDGMWSPFLNRKSILIGEIDQYALISPMELNQNTPYEITVSIFPHELTSSDTLVDGPVGNCFRLYNNTLFIWVDFDPSAKFADAKFADAKFADAKFAHRTAYILLSKYRSRVEKGNWWPILNNKVILYNETNKWAVISPFVLTNPFEPVPIDDIVQ